MPRFNAFIGAYSFSQTLRPPFSLSHPSVMESPMKAICASFRPGAARVSWCLLSHQPLGILLVHGFGAGVAAAQSFSVPAGASSAAKSALDNEHGASKAAASMTLLRCARFMVSASFARAAHPSGRGAVPVLRSGTGASRPSA
jgi:hypothetical protein